MLKPFYRRVVVIGSSILGLMLIVGVAGASHSWGSYHWARTANPFTLKLGDNISSKWDSHLLTASNDWSVSDVLDTTVIVGSTNPKTCRPTSGRVEVCNNKYGRNGWLGVAQIWVSGDHITQATTKLNDTYFSTATYNTPAWRQFVMCQEVGHAFGLDHQDEVFNNPNLGSCMDYTNDPSTNQHPNQHDYDQLTIIYEHLEALAVAGQAAVSGKNVVEGDADYEDWGKQIRKSEDGRGSFYEKNLGNGKKLFTFVVWAK